MSSLILLTNENYALIFINISVKMHVDDLNIISNYILNI